MKHSCKIAGTGTFPNLRNRIAVVLGIAFRLYWAIPSCAQTLSQQGGRIVIGPNTLVSRDGDIAHCETMIAANPRDPKNLVGGSIVAVGGDASFATKPYVSFDGGANWTDINLPTGTSECNPVAIAGRFSSEDEFPPWRRDHGIHDKEAGIS